MRRPIKAGGGLEKMVIAQHDVFGDLALGFRTEIGVDCIGDGRGRFDEQRMKDNAPTRAPDAAIALRLAML